MESNATNTRATRPEREPLRLRLHAQGGVNPASFETICRDNDSWRLELLDDGSLLAREPNGTQSGHRSLLLSLRLARWAERDGSGLAFASSTGFTLPGGAILSPDFAWLRRARWDALPADVREGFAPIVPDFVVELASPTDSRRWLREKMDRWIAAGARLGWLIDPRDRTVSVHRPAHAPETHPTSRPLSGEPELPGLTLDFDGIV